MHSSFSLLPAILGIIRHHKEFQRVSSSATRYPRLPIRASQGILLSSLRFYSFVWFFICYFYFFSFLFFSFLLLPCRYRLIPNTSCVFGLDLTSHCDGTSPLLHHPHLSPLPLPLTSSIPLVLPSNPAVTIRP